jgi:hypothetical protein
MNAKSIFWLLVLIGIIGAALADKSSPPKPTVQTQAQADFERRANAEIDRRNNHRNAAHFGALP